jgi:small subunit ribosomal protein S17e
MGAIKPKYIKGIAKQLMQEVQGFTGDFDVNKKIIDANTNIESKHIRNRTAGYITHKMRRGGDEGG